MPREDSASPPPIPRRSADREHRRRSRSPSPVREHRRRSRSSSPAREYRRRSRSSSPGREHRKRTRSPPPIRRRSASREHRRCSRSSSPIRHKPGSRGHRRPSRSPRREADRARRGHGGFRWKEKRPNDKDETSRNEEHRLDRGYKEHYRARSPRRDQDSDDRERNLENDNPERSKRERKEKKKEKKKKQQASTVPSSGEPMITVVVGDRINTKVQIPCFASDPIGLFKVQVAARTGRKVDDILLKRQGERPFKDQLTLEDYGVSNGARLDLELGTGD